VGVIVGGAGVIVGVADEVDGAVRVGEGAMGPDVEVRSGEAVWDSPGIAVHPTRKITQTSPQPRIWVTDLVPKCSANSILASIRRFILIAFFPLGIILETSSALVQRVGGEVSAPVVEW
jgi:hypothetical protein